MENKRWYVARKYYGGDGPITLLFDNPDDRDEFVSQNNYCNIGEDVGYEDIYNGASHIGIFVTRHKDGKFYDSETGTEV